MRERTHQLHAEDEGEAGLVQRPHGVTIVEDGAAVTDIVQALIHLGGVAALIERAVGRGGEGGVSVAGDLANHGQDMVLQTARGAQIEEGGHRVALHQGLAARLILVRLDERGHDVGRIRPRVGEEGEDLRGNVPVRREMDRRPAPDRRHAHSSSERWRDRRPAPISSSESPRGAVGSLPPALVGRLKCIPTALTGGLESGWKDHVLLTGRRGSSSRALLVGSRSGRVLLVGSRSGRAGLAVLAEAGGGSVLLLLLLVGSSSSGSPPPAVADVALVDARGVLPQVGARVAHAEMGLPRCKLGARVAHAEMGLPRCKLGEARRGYRG